MQTSTPAMRCRVTKLLAVGCLLVGAVFMIKMDAVGMIAPTALGRVGADLASRVAAPMMQMGGWWDARRGRYNPADRYGGDFRRNDQNPYNDGPPFEGDGMYDGRFGTGHTDRYGDRYGSQYGQNGQRSQVGYFQYGREPVQQNERVQQNQGMQQQNRQDRYSDRWSQNGRNGQRSQVGYFQSGREPVEQNERVRQNQGMQQQNRQYMDDGMQRGGPQERPDRDFGQHDNRLGTSYTDRYSDRYGPQYDQNGQRSQVGYFQSGREPVQQNERVQQNQGMQQQNRQGRYSDRWSEYDPQNGQRSQVGYFRYGRDPVQQNERVQQNPGMQQNRQDMDDGMRRGGPQERPDRDFGQHDNRLGTGYTDRYGDRYGRSSGQYGQVGYGQSGRQSDQFDRVEQPAGVQQAPQHPGPGGAQNGVHRGAEESQHGAGPAQAQDSGSPKVEVYGGQQPSRQDWGSSSGSPKVEVYGGLQPSQEHSGSQQSDTGDKAMSYEEYRQKYANNQQPAR